MNPEWVQVRLRRETHAALRKFGGRLVEWERRTGKTELSCDTDQPGIDLLVKVLLRRDEQAQERNRRRKRGKKEAQNQAAENGEFADNERGNS